MICQNHELCARKAAMWKVQQEETLEIGERLLSELRDSLNRGESSLNITNHGETRQTERCLSLSTIRSLVSEEAWPFEYYKNTFGTEKLSLIGWIKIGEGKYRPIHIILKKAPNTTLWKIVTIYDPRTEEFKWGNNYQDRKCFCEK
jgi:hypothetical protein